jgi:hypothetical protein
MKCNRVVLHGSWRPLVTNGLGSTEATCSLLSVLCKHISHMGEGSKRMYPLCSIGKGSIFVKLWRKGNAFYLNTNI